ncbi:MAG TPA: GYD domain-containing protein [Candidatus Methylomirabilis sp.]|nr:GYD domain-containing protein [Candidatus Methylomirabilis sp.]
MPKYLLEVSYTAEGAKGVLKEGGSKRRAAAEQAAKSSGTKIEAFYFAFGDTDVFAIMEAPDHASIAAVSMAVAASGAARVKTVVLMNPEELDQAAKRKVSYRAPGK